MDAVAKVHLVDPSEGPGGACRRRKVDDTGLKVALCSRETAILLILRVFTQRDAMERLDWSIARRCRSSRSSSGLSMRGPIILIPSRVAGQTSKITIPGIVYY